MTKKDIVRNISETLDLPQVFVKEMVQATLDEMIRVLAEEGRLELRNFGVFEVRYRAPRTARNPHTMKSVKTKAKYSVGFKPGTGMAKTVQQTQSAKAKVAKRAAAKKAKESQSPEASSEAAQ